MTRVVAGALASLLVVGMVSLPPSAGAAPAPSAAERREDIGEELQRLGEELDETAAEEAGVLAELEVTRRARVALDDTVADLEADVAGAEADLAAAEADLAGADAAEGAAGRRLRAAQARLAQSQQVIEVQAVSRFMRNGVQTEVLDVFLQVRDVQDLHEAAAFVGAVARSQADEVRRHQALGRSTAELEAQAARARLDAVRRRDEVAGQKQALEATRAEQVVALSQVAGEEHREEELLAGVQETRGDYEQRIVDLRAESESITALLVERQRSQAVAARPAEPSSPSTPSPSPSPSIRRSRQLAYPLANAVVTSRFGFRTHPIFGTRRLHAGVDFRGATGTPVLAAAAGTVVFAGPRGGYGNAVVIDHGNALATLYAHQSRLSVTTGARVAAGQAVGTVGSTGFSTGPHLHFETRLNGTPVDPLNYL